jgi:prevent-host-death family protein
MDTTISAKELLGTLPQVVARVRRGARYTVLHRSRPAFRIVPVEDVGSATAALDDDPLHGAAAVGRSTDGRAAADHDAALCWR